MRQVFVGLVMLAGVSAASAQAATMAEHAHKPGQISTSLAITARGKTMDFSLADLQAMPQRTVSVHNGHSNADERYAGVAVSDLLTKFGVTLQDGGAKAVYDSYLRATGTDGYFVVYSTSEVEGAMHAGEVIVAMAEDGKPLGPDGQFKLVSTEDKRPARWVRNLKALALVDVQ